MHPDQIRELLEQVKSGASGIDEAFVRLAELPFTDLANAKIDNHRALRCGFAEVVLCRGKEPRDVARIIEEGLRSSSMMLATRAEKRHVDAIKERFPGALVNLRGGTVRIGNPPRLKARGSVMVVTAGTGDIPVAEEALETLRAFGCDGYHCYDVGVAGLHRVLAALPKIREAAVIICVAGMEGALPSVLSGLVACPVIAVPTSVGYGASFNGVAALLGMLNSCSGGVSVVNIDNGFGAALSALRIVADRDWPMPESSAQPVEVISAEEVALSRRVERDEQLERLERAVDRLTTIASKSVVVESPRIEINHPNQDAQVLRLEQAIVELAAITSKQKDLEEKKLTTKSAQQNELVTRLEKTAHDLAEASKKAVIVESPRIEINHPGQDGQVARLEKAIHEMAAIAQLLKEASSQQDHTAQTELAARMDRTLESLAAAAARPIHVEYIGAPSALPSHVAPALPAAATAPDVARTESSQTPLAETAMHEPTGKTPPPPKEKLAVVKVAARSKKPDSQPKKNKK